MDAGCIWCISFARWQCCFHRVSLPRDASQTSSCWLSQERVEFLQATSLRLKGEIETAEVGPSVW